MGNMGKKTAESAFTLLELLVVVAIVGILTAIAIPAVQRALLVARAQAIVGDLKVIESAVHEYYADNNRWPPDLGPGQQPPELKDYLRGRVNWNNTKAGYQLDWDNWVLDNGQPKHPSTGVLIGISVTTKKNDLIETLKRISPKPFQYTLNNNYTYVIEPYRPPKK